MTTVETSVARALLEIGAVQFRPDQPVRFKSGILSPVYIDNRRLPYWPRHWRAVIDGFRGLIAENGLEFDVIAGIETAGIPHSAALGYALEMPSVFVRKQPKEHGLKQRVEGGPVHGQRVLLVEDLATTGGSSLSGVAALRDEGAVVRDCIVIVSYNFPEMTRGFAAADVRVHTLASLPAILAQAARMGLLDAAARAAVDDWLHDPGGWESKHSVS